MIEYYCNVCGDFVDKEDHWKTCTGLKENHREEKMATAAYPYTFPEIPKGYNISIQRVRGGYYVEVGCERFVFTSQNVLADFVAKLLISPEEMTKQFYKDQEKADHGTEPAGMPSTR